MNKRDASSFHKTFFRDANAADVSLLHICQRCVEIFDLAGATVTLSTEQFGQEHLASFGGSAGELEDLQFAIGQGPGVDVAILRETIYVESLSNAVDKWPQFSSIATQKGITGLIAVPLDVGAVQLGVFTLYFKHPTTQHPAFDQVQLAASYITDSLLLQWKTTDTNASSTPLYGAVVHQATGMIGAQLECGMAEALVRLRAHSFAHNKTVADIAREVVDRKLRFD